MCKLVNCLAVLTFVKGIHGALPLVDFDRMGTVGLAGAFSGIDFFHNSSLSIDPSASTLLNRTFDGSITAIASTNPGGRITTGCMLGSSYFLAGNFTSIGGVSAVNVASYSPSSGTFSSLGSNGPNGEVFAAFCDTKSNKLWVGGKFTSPGASVATWDIAARSWDHPPFTGVSGAQAQVSSITSNASDSSIFFTGSFVTLFGNTTRLVSGTNNPNVPFSSGATPFSSSLVPIPLQGAQVDGSPSTDLTGFSNIGNVLCPAGADGSGNSWFAADGSTPLITIRTFSFILANGVRLGNTFQANHGTTVFSVTTIPDNYVRTMHFIDPVTGENQTCSTSCPLSTDSSVLYQDFLFDSTLAITGVQIKLSGFTGTSSGLHILQLLSAGAFASALDSNNSVSCFAPNPSNTTSTGTWQPKRANTDIAGTVQTVLVASADAGTSSSSGPTFTWMPYVSAAGIYDINMLIPGCSDLQDCDLRTTVKVVVFPGGGLQPWVSNISQTNFNDAQVQIYSGPVVPSSPNFVTTISMSLSDQSSGQGQGAKVELVADRIELILKTANASSSMQFLNLSSSIDNAKRGFGFFEWPRSTSGDSDDATHALSPSLETSLDVVGLDLFDGMADNTSFNSLTSAIVSSVVHHPSGVIFLGGTFELTSGPANGSSNIVAYKAGALAGLASGGLNGHVSSLLLIGNKLVVGGSFSDTASSSQKGSLEGIAIYDIQENSWSSLGAGVDGQVMSIGTVGDEVQVLGNFTRAFPVAGGTASLNAPGFATWSLSKQTWTNTGGLVNGDMAFIGNASASQFIAGKVAAFRKYGASGMVVLQNGNNDGPRVVPLGAPLASISNVSSGVSLPQKRSRLHQSSAWLSRIALPLFFRRQSTSQLPKLPLPPPSSAPAVLAGAFWTNITTSSQAAIIGGNFSFYPAGSTTSFSAAAVYDLHTGSLQGLMGPQINGTVYALLVDLDQLYVGGTFDIQGLNANGLAIYDLTKQEWNVSGLQPLQPGQDSTVIVRSISKSSSQADTIIVAGSFAKAGALTCQAICAFNTVSRQWNTLGNGINGDVAAVAFAGQNQDLLVAAGSLALTNNIVSNVAQFGFGNSSWNALGSAADLPGPVTAVEVNGGNASSIFAAGHSTTDGLPFLSFWNGKQWSSLKTNLQPETVFSQLTMVPLQNTHSANSIIEKDRMLMVSGSLTDPSFGNASSVLFDGQSFIPYIVSTSQSGMPGSVSSLFRSFATFSFIQRHLLAAGVVILISIAISAGVVFLLALMGILWTLFTRREDKLKKFDGDDEDDDSTRHRPSSLLEHINAATRTTILGTSPFGNLIDEKGEKEKPAKDLLEQDPFGPDASNYVRAETPSDAVGGMLAEETSRPAHARYSFEGTGEGELRLSAGAEVEVLDDRDPAWWYARDVRTGLEGVVPAAYLY